MANAAVLNHSSALGFDSAGDDSTLGRSDPNVPPVFPVLLLSNDKSGVKGWPVYAVTMVRKSVFRTKTFRKGSS